MSWKQNGNKIIDNKGTIVCNLQTDINPFFADIIRKGDYALELMARFGVDKYDEGKMVSKALFNEICELLDEDKNYDFKWLINKNGDIETTNQVILCTFPVQGTQDARLIKYLPEIFATFQKLITNYKSSKPIQQKPIYEALCRIQDKISDT
jgi:hypothetical protein